MIRLKVEYPNRITNLVFPVYIEPLGQLALEPGREVEVTVLTSGLAISDTISKTIYNERVKYLVRLKAGFMSSQLKKITVYVRDSLTKELLDSKEIPIDIVYGELDI